MPSICAKSSSKRISQFYPTTLDNQEQQEPIRSPNKAAITNDERTLHGITPMLADAPTRQGYRDVLFITFNKR
ncbi:2OG-Fe dioxygenase family protein [Pectobacteriaceae bacterium CE90]|nr:2OG-Fe dioxygenase family protein [Pectobacteriaceae bacterium CE90]